MNLAHGYASPYYDPVKAHEYYMQHRVLTGRTSTAGLNDKGKEAARYVKNSLNDERKRLTDSSRERLKSALERNSSARSNAINAAREKTKADIKAHTHKIQTEAAKLRIMIESGAFKNDPEKRYDILNKIKSLKEENDKKREELLGQFQNKSNAIRTQSDSTAKNLRESNRKYTSSLAEEYQKKYEDEIAKMLSDPSFVKTKSSKKETKSVSKTNKSSSSNSSSTYTQTKKEQTSAWAMRKKARLEKRREELSKEIEELRRADRVRKMKSASRGGAAKARTAMYHSDIYLAHHGILGQKWGIRRYQNEDGSLTPAGKKHYGDGEEKSSSRKRSSASKKIAIGAAVIGGSALAAYGGYKLSETLKKKSAYKNLVQAMLNADIMVADLTFAKN